MWRSISVVAVLALAGCANVQHAAGPSPNVAAEMDCTRLNSEALKVRGVIEANVDEMAKIFATPLDVIMPITDDFAAMANKDAMAQLRLLRTVYTAKACPAGPFGGVPF